MPEAVFTSTTSTSVDPSRRGTLVPAAGLLGLPGATAGASIAVVGPDAALVADTLAAADVAETAARDWAHGLVTVDDLICASDAACLAWRRAEAVAEHTGGAALAFAADRARRAYRLGDRG